MVQKKTVSVPDELSEKMEHHKQELNFSKIFQEAIREKIQKIEDHQKRIKGDSTMEETIERLRREKAEFEKDLIEAGEEDGRNFAENSSYAEIQKALMLTYDDPFTYSLFKGSDPGYWMDYFRDIVGDREIEIIHEDEWEKSITLEFEAYFRGWKMGVRSFWLEVKDKL